MSAIVWYSEHFLALPFFGIGIKTDLFQSCGHFCRRRPGRRPSPRSPPLSPRGRCRPSPPPPSLPAPACCPGTLPRLGDWTCPRRASARPPPPGLRSQPQLPGSGWAAAGSCPSPRTVHPLRCSPESPREAPPGTRGVPGDTSCTWVGLRGTGAAPSRGWKVEKPQGPLKPPFVGPSLQAAVPDGSHFNF